MNEIINHAVIDGFVYKYIARFSNSKKVETYIKELVGTEIQEVQGERTDKKIRYETQKWNAETKQYDFVSERFEPVEKEILIQELKESYVIKIREAKDLGLTEEVERLQAEFNTKYTELNESQE